jgi:hypothetical protein
VRRCAPLYYYRQNLPFPALDKRLTLEETKNSSAKQINHSLTFFTFAEIARLVTSTLCYIASFRNKKMG